METLERQVALLTAQLGALGGRTPSVALPPGVRLAKTFTSGSYPAAGANTFEIRFVDPTLDTWSAGTRTPTYTVRSAAVQAVAHVVGGKYVTEGTIVAVIEINRKWWIIDLLPGSTRIYGTLGAPLTAATASFSTSSYAILSQGAQSPTGSQTIYNSHGWDADTGELWRAEHNQGTDHWELYQITAICPE